MNFPWKRGDGHQMVTISLPLILSPIIRELREEKSLSKTISEFLWVRYGNPDIAHDEEKMQVLHSTIEMLQSKIKKLEKKNIKSREIKDKQIRLDELSEDINHLKKYKNAIKNNPNGRWSLSTYNNRLTNGEKNHIKELIEIHKSESGVIDYYSELQKEKAQLILEIGEGVVS